MIDAYHFVVVCVMWSMNVALVRRCLLDDDITRSHPSSIVLQEIGLGTILKSVAKCIRIQVWECTVGTGVAQKSKSHFEDID